MMSDINKLYDILGISRGATKETITKAYRALARAYHPVKLQRLSLSEEEMKEKIETFYEIQESYNILIDERLRKIYDTEGYDAVQIARSIEVSSKTTYSLEDSPEDYKEIFGDKEVLVGNYKPEVTFAFITSTVTRICKEDVVAQVEVDLNGEKVTENIIFPKGSSDNTLILVTEKGKLSPLTHNRYVIIGILKLNKSSTFDMVDMDIHVKRTINPTRNSKGQLHLNFTLLSKPKSIEISEDDLGKQIRIPGQGVVNDVLGKTGDLVIKVGKQIE